MLNSRAMSATVIVRYDGPALADHRMDIADIAPALLGISELCKIANRKFNGERASVKVLIGTDAEHQCFQLNLQVVQTLWEHTKSVLSNEDIKSAKELLEWIGILATAGGGAVGLLHLLKLLKKGRISETQLTSVEGRDRVVLVIQGDNNITSVVVHPQTLELLRDEPAVANAKKVVQPLLQDGYERVEFEARGSVTEVIDKDDAVAIASLDSSKIEKTEVDEPQTIIAWVTVYSPVYDPKAPLWRFKFGDAHVYMDITETDIAEMTMKRGTAMIDDAYKVELEIRQEHKPGGGITNHYRIKKVLEFRPARLPYQTDAFRDWHAHQ